MNMNLNFNGTTVAEIYSNEISRQRAEEFVEIFRREAVAMVRDHTSYTATINDGDGEQLCVHKGKVMQRLLEFANNEYERMFVAHSMEKIVEFLNRNISNEILHQTLEEKLK